MLDELEALKTDLASSNWTIVDPVVFKWQTNLSDIVPHPSSVFESEAIANPLIVPFKDLNWDNYAQTLLALATANFSGVFKKMPFNPDDYFVLIGPCTFDIPSATTINSGAALGGPNSVASQVTSLLLSSQKFDYSNSMEDVSNNMDSSMQRRRPVTRRRERVTSFASSQKAELGLMDIVKLVHKLLGCTEQLVVDAFIKTEPLAMGLLDKQFIGITAEDAIPTASSSLFTFQILQQLILHDNEGQTPILYRIFNLVHYFFIDTLGHRFPESMAIPMQALCRLFLDGSLPISLFDNENKVFALLVGTAEIDFELNKLSAIGLEAYKAAATNTNDPRLVLIQALMGQSKLSEISVPEAGLRTRYFRIFNSTVTLGQIQSHMDSQNLIKKLAAVEVSEDIEELMALCQSAPMALIHVFHGENRLRYCRLILKLNVEGVDTAAICSILHEELMSLKSAQMSLETFLPYLNVLQTISNPQLHVQLSLFGLFWNIWARKPLIPTESFSNIGNLFCNFLAGVIKTYCPATDLLRNILSWASQERVLGYANGTLLLTAFEQYSQSDSTNEDRCLFFYSVALSLYRFPNFVTQNAPDAEPCWDEWDRTPLGLKEFALPELTLDFVLNLLQQSIFLYNYFQDEESLAKNGTVADAIMIPFVDWIKKQFEAISGNRVRVFNLNLLHIQAFLNGNFIEHAVGAMKPLLEAQFKLYPETFNSLYWALVIRCDLCYRELQGRKKPMDVLKTIRKDLKMALAIDNTDLDVWVLLGQCYHDSALHLLSNELEQIQAQLPKIRRLIRKGILSFWRACQLNPAWLEYRRCLVELIDWAIHEPTNLVHSSSAELEVSFLHSLGLRSCKLLIKEEERKLKWLAVLRFADISRLKPSSAFGPESVCVIARNAVDSALSCLNENVYEQSALYHSLVEYYTNLFGLNLNDTDLLAALESLKLPESLKPPLADDGSKEYFLKHVEALNTFDRRKVFHAHHWLAAMVSWKLCQNQQKALEHFCNIFPFLKRARGPASFMQIYQPDLDRPAWYLVSGHRYCLDLIDFLCDQTDLVESAALLELFSKKIHYARRTIYNFVRVLEKATVAYLQLALRRQQLGDEMWTRMLPVMDELLTSLRKESAGPVPSNVKQLNRQVRLALEK